MIILVLSLNLIRAQLVPETLSLRSYESSQIQQPLSLLISTNKVIIQHQQYDRPLIQIDVVQRRVSNKTQTSIRIHDQYKTLLEHQLSNNQEVFIIIRQFYRGHQIAFIYLYNEYLILPQTTFNKYGFQEYLKYENSSLKLDSYFTQIQQEQTQQLQYWNSDSGKSINKSQAEIAFQIYFDQGSFNFNDIKYSDCQSVLSSINYKLLTDSGFKRINIYLSLRTVTKNIICRIQNQSNIDIIIANIYQQNTMIDYIFEGFNFISIKDCAFEFQTIFLKSNRLLLQNISITENSYQIQIQSNFIEIFNITCKQATKAVFQIESLQVRIIIYDLLIQDTILTAGYLINIPLNSQVTIDIDGIVIINSKLLNFLFFNIQYYAQLALCIRNLLILDSDIRISNSTHQFLFISKYLQLYNVKILNVNLKKLILFQAQVVILTNITFIKVQFITTQIMNNNEYIIIPEQLSLQIVNMQFKDCSVSTVLKNSIFLILFELYQINIYVDQLSLTGTAFQLFNTQDCLQASFVNIILNNISNYQETTQLIFEINSQNASITNFTATWSIGYFTIFRIRSENFLMLNVSIIYFEYELWLIIILTQRVQIHQLKIVSNPTESTEIQLQALKVVSSLEIFMQECILILQQPIILASYLVRIDKLYLEQIGKPQEITDYGLLIIQFMNLTIMNSEFNEVQQTYYNCDQLIDKCSFNFTNNRVKIFKPQFEFLSLFTIKWINYMYISKNILQSKTSTTMTFFNIAVLEQCQILDNFMTTQGQAIQIFNLITSLTLISNLTVKCYDFSIDPYIGLSTIYISKGYLIIVIISQLALSDLLIMTRSYRIFDFMQQNSISLQSIYLQNSIVDIFMRISTDRALNLLMRNICSLNQNRRAPKQNQEKEFNFIEIISLGLSKIEINNLTIKGLIYSNTALICLRAQLQLFINNMRLLNNRCNRHCLQFIDLSNSQNMNSTIIHNLLVFNNTAMSVFEILLPAVSFENTLIIGAFNCTLLYSLTQKSTYIDIKDSEIILNNTIPSVKLQYTSNNTRFKEFVQIQDEFIVSFDNGKNFAQNMKNGLNNYQAIFGKNKKHFYVPSGQRLDDFQFLNKSALHYIQYRVILFFDFKEKAKKPHTVCSLVYQDIELNEIIFQLGEKLNNSIIIVAKPWTEINFVTVCDIGESKPALYFKAIVMDCQLGEIRINDICLPCNVQLQLYSVKFHSTQCYPLNEISMKNVDRALIELNPGYWRPHFTNDQIEACTPQQDSCKGGFVFGNQLCKVGYIGAICSECDLFGNQNSQSHTKNLWQICNPCHVTLQQISKQIFSFVISAILVFIAVISYYQATKKNILITISWPPYQKIVKWQFDSLGIWIALLSLYCQNLINVNQNSILSLAPFYVDYDFLTNTSFNFMNLIDCVFAMNFQSEHWVYIRVVFMITNYCVIFQLFIVILLLYLNQTKIQYSLILLTMPLINIYNANILSIFTYLILLLLPIEYSGKKYIQAYVTLNETQLHQLLMIILISPLIFIIVIVLPIIYFFKISNSINNNTLRNHFRYFSYLFKKNAYYFELLSKLFSQMILIEIYTLKKQVFARLLILIFIVNLQYFAFAFIQPYYSKKLNNWNLTLLLMFDIQLIISGLIDQTSHNLKSILSLIFYYISAYVILYSVLQIILQISDEYYQLFDKARLKIIPYIGNKVLKQHRLFRIKRYYSIIQEDLRTRSISKNQPQ